MSSFNNKRNYRQPCLNSWGTGTASLFVHILYKICMPVKYMIHLCVQTHEHFTGMFCQGSFRITGIVKDFMGHCTRATARAWTEAQLALSFPATFFGQYCLLAGAALHLYLEMCSQILITSSLKLQLARANVLWCFTQFPCKAGFPLNHLYAYCT